MKTLSVREMRAALGRLDQLLEEEQEIIITRRRKAVARLLPLKPSRRMPSHGRIRAQMPRLSSSTGLIRDDRNAR